MDPSCLVGLCAAVAAVAPGTSVAMAPQPGASDPGSDTLTAAEGWVAVIVLCVVLAHAATAFLVRRYERRMDRLMREESATAFREAMPGACDRTPDLLLDAVGRQRRAMLAVLVGIVAIYTVTASLVMHRHAPRGEDAVLDAVHLATYALLFASLCGPVVLLGTSTARFERHFWRWFAPPTFVAVSLQVALIMERTASEDLTGIGWLLAALVTFTAVLMAGRRATVRLLSPSSRAWMRARTWRRAVLSVPAVLAGLASLVPFLPWDAMVERAPFGIIVGALSIGLVWFALVDRIRRIVAPLLALASFAAAVAVAVTATVLSRWLGEASATPVVIAPLAGVAGFYLALAWVGLAYRQKVFSDAQFQVFCWMLSAGAMVVLLTWLSVQTGQRLDAIQLGLELSGCTGLSLLAYWAAVRFAIRPLPAHRRLLVLRVFSQERRGERLLDELEERWRHVGPLMLIGGTDVAKRTIDPAKAAHFLRRRLHDICVPHLFELHRRVAGMDEDPDPDGRYRVNEFFCTADLWKQADALLLERSDAVVVDLTEFTERNAGTAWELGLLGTRGALPRTVLLVSERTDRAALRRVLRLSPDAPLPDDGVIEVEQAVDGRRLVEALVRRMPVVPMARPVPLPLPLDDVAPADPRPASGEGGTPAGRRAVQGLADRASAAGGQAA